MTFRIHCLADIFRAARLQEMTAGCVFAGGVEGTSKDRATYVAAEIVDADDVKSAAAEGIKFFEKSGITIDASTQKQKDVKVNGIDAFDLSCSGKDKDGPTNVSLTIVGVTPKQPLLLTYWGSADGDTSNGAEHGAMAASIKPLAK